MDYRLGYISTNMVLSESLYELDSERSTLTEAEKEHILFQKMDDALGDKNKKAQRKTGIEHTTRGLFRGPGIG